MGLIDEYRIFVNPIILGSSKPQFNPDGHRDDHKLNLKLLETKIFGTGMVLLHYVTAINSHTKTIQLTFRKRGNNEIHVAGLS